MMGISGYTWAWAALAAIILVGLVALRRPANPSAVTTERDFSVDPAELVEKLSVEAIEEREMVYDPLNAVPNLPFGHLNPVWCRFLGRRPADCELWSFSSERERSYGQREYRSGYVAVVDGIPGPYIYTVSNTSEPTSLYRHVSE